MYYLLLLFVLGWSVYAEIIHKLSQYQIIVIILISLIVELLLVLNSKFESAEVNYEEEKEEDKK